MIFFVALLSDYDCFLFINSGDESRLLAWCTTTWKPLLYLPPFARQIHVVIEEDRAMLLPAAGCYSHTRKKNT
jgi:hypothetical protein